MEAVAEDLYTVQKIEAILQRLSPERLRVAADFLAYLDERESNDATAHIPLVMEKKKQLRNRCREEIVALAGRRKEM